MSLLAWLFPPRYKRIYRQLARRATLVAAYEERFVSLDDAELSQNFLRLRERLAAGEDRDGEIMNEAFAFARIAAERALGLRPFDCQIVGGMALHAGTIAEMATGEGKTLVATLAASFNALTGTVHLVTVNDYLARRDSEWMRPMYEMLGLSVGLVVHDTPPEQRKEEYARDIVYITNTELGFDFLRDNMALHKSQVVQGEFRFAIIDEVDSILIDEARTPLIISGAAEDKSKLYRQLRGIVSNFKPQAREETDEEPLAEEEHGDYLVDEKARSVELTDRGHLAIEERLQKLGLLREGDTLYAPEYIEIFNAVGSVLRAEKIYRRDIDYLVQDDQILLIDEHTGRALPGRRLSQGNHQALEVKEGVSVQAESQTLASITYQNLFRMFDKLAGMTGTALTEAEEFREIYALEVIPIPTNLPVARIDYEDLVYTTKADKLRAVVGLIRERVEAGAPCLVGTASVEASEHLSGLLKKAKISHQVLNARRHAHEAENSRRSRQTGRSDHSHQHGGARHRYCAGRQTACRRRCKNAGTPRQRPRKSIAGRRSACDSHRTPRIAPHRQPVARAQRQAGRPRRVAVFSVAGRRPYAHIRRRMGAVCDPASQCRRRRAHRSQYAVAGDSQCPASRGNAAFRYSQATAGIRRHSQRAAAFSLRRAQRLSVCRQCAGPHRCDDRGGDERPGYAGDRRWC